MCKSVVTKPGTTLFKQVCCILLLGFTIALQSVSSAQEPSEKPALKEKRKTNEKKLSPRDSLLFEQQQKNIETSSEFYSKVNSTAHKNFFSRQLYPLIFKKPQTGLPSDVVSETDSIPYQAAEGKVIRSIRIYKSEVFGSSIFDTTIISDNSIDKALNKIHFNTHDAVIRSYLRVQKGDRLSPVLLSDNERIIRQSALFEDARFIVSSTSDSDSVDLVLVIKDVFPLGFDVLIRNANSSRIKLFNRNILGFGHQLEQSFELNTLNKPAFYMSEGAYKVRNIMGSFTDAKLIWQTKPEIRKIGIEITKPFISPETKLGGGINIQECSAGNIPGISNPATRIDYTIYDLWSGYSTIINRYKLPNAERSVFAITGRYYNINYHHSPPVVLESSLPAVTINRYIASLSLVRSGYYLDNMVFSFGRTEDIPTGHLAQLTMGYETSVLANRYYMGIKLLSGQKIQKGGFIYSWFESGGYLTNNKFNDGIAGLGSEYISKLLKAGSYRLRSFGSLSYKTGINRSSIEELKINEGGYQKTYHDFYLTGDQRLKARFETVVFTPYYLLGFRFAAYSFIEAAMVAPSGKFILSSPVYPAIGLGLRIKNENLVFSTFQFGLIWYGRPDVKGNNMFFEFSDIPEVELKQFTIEAPEFATFR
ncbi:MAG: hypothetical protein HGA37_02720 [Lentimicrobium sp.]|nr:hypothetical protein [Lentimicrobium sp.]